MDPTSPLDPFTTSWPQHPSAIHGPSRSSLPSHVPPLLGLSEMCHAPPMRRSRGHPPLRDKPGRNDGGAPRVKRVCWWGARLQGFWLEKMVPWFSLKVFFLAMILDLLKGDLISCTYKHGETNIKPSMFRKMFYLSK